MKYLSKFKKYPTFYSEAVNRDSKCLVNGELVLRLTRALSNISIVLRLIFAQGVPFPQSRPVNALSKMKAIIKMKVRLFSAAHLNARETHNDRVVILHFDWFGSNLFTPQ